MYKILLKAKGATKDVYSFYQVDQVSPTTGAVTKVDYETTSLTDLATKYEDLLKEYPTSILVPMHALDVSLVTSITE